MFRKIVGSKAHASRHDSVLANIGYLDAATEARRDAAGDALFLARELEQVSAESYDVMIDPRMGRQLIPFVNELAEGAETYSFDMYTGVAKAEWINNYASPVGQADASKTRVSFTARSFGSSYAYSVQDLAAAAMAGTGRSLDRERARMARIAHETFIDDLIAVGDSERSISGILTLLEDLGYTEDGSPVSGSTQYPYVSPIDGLWLSGTPPTSDGALSDLQKLLDAVEQNTAQNFKASRIVLPLSVKSFMAKPYSSTIPNTLESVFKANNPGVDLRYWNRLNTASASQGPRAFAYVPSPSTFKFVLAYDYRELPAQAVNYAYQIPTMARVLGLVPVYPLAMSQMDLDS